LRIIWGLDGEPKGLSLLVMNLAAELQSLDWQLSTRHAAVCPNRFLAHTTLATRTKTDNPKQQQLI